MDTELSKSKTLLYFFEYLMCKGEPQKWEHLSSLFNNKTFTKDMCEVVKGSVAGLRELLSEHPSLFTIIDDELVAVNDYGSASTDVSLNATRDYIQETKEFFQHHLQSYGIGVEVPIYCLHGYRSQAKCFFFNIVVLWHFVTTNTCIGTKPEHLQKFLMQHPDTFRIIDKNVILLGSKSLKNGSSSECNNNFPDYRVRQLSTPLDKNDVNEAIANSCAGNGESNGPEMKLENVCKHNCPALSVISNVISLEQLRVVDKKKTIKENTQMITTVAEAQQVTDCIFESIANAGSQAVVSFSCVVARIGEQKKIKLMALGTPYSKAFLFDVLHCPGIMTDGGLKVLLECDRVIKVMHDCRHKSVVLFEQFETILRCVFDTQSASAVLSYQDNGSPANQASMMSFNHLIELYCPLNPIKDEFLRWKPYDRRWYRPVTEETIIFAACEVLFLMQIYGSTVLLIKEENKPLLSDLCTEKIYGLIQPKAVKSQQMQRKIAYETADLKAKLAQPMKNIVLSRRQIQHLRYLDLTEDEKEKILLTPQLIKKLEASQRIDEEKSVVEELDSASRDRIRSLSEESNGRKTTVCCCDCQRDQSCQTLSTGAIGINEIYLT